MATRKPLGRIARAKRYLASPAGQAMTHRAPALVVFGVAAWQSYWHIVEVANRYGEHETALIMPLGLDGLLLVANRYLTHAKTRSGRLVAVLAFLAGMGATLTANLLAAEPSTLARAVAVWPALAMILTAGMLHTGDRKATRRAQRPAKPQASTKLRSVS